LKMGLSVLAQNEDALWYGLNTKPVDSWTPSNGIHSFLIGGYYVLRESETLTFIRCGNHKDRPSQADNLHLDVWYKGQNVLLDAGSYQYNADEETLGYFIGTVSHNTVMLNDFDQMKKGARFIWYHWSQCNNASFIETGESYIFKGKIIAFKQVSNGIMHQREMIKLKNEPKWIIKDSIVNKPPNIFVKQLWHLPLRHFPIKWTSVDENNEEIKQEWEEGYISELYGKKERAEMIGFKTIGDKIITEFEIEA
jgi:hypothetical protein